MTDNKPNILNDALILQEMLYKSEQNPVYVWEAIARASLTEGALPTWVLDYLAQLRVVNIQSHLVTSCTRAVNPPIRPSY